MITIPLAISIFLTGVLISCNKAEITKENAIEIAGREAIRLGYEIQNMDVEVTMYNTPWNKYLPEDNQSKYNLERREKLLGKKYWAVYFSPKGLWSGGDICIFINHQTGHIIANLRGK